MIQVSFPDKQVREYPKGVTAMEIAKSISEGLVRNVLAAKINGEIWVDLSAELGHMGMIVFDTK